MVRKTSAATVERALRDNWDRLFGYAYRLSGNRDAASDLLQSCAVKALGAVAPDEEARLRAWLFAILRNIWIDERRRNQASEDIAADELVGHGWHYDDHLIARISVQQALSVIAPAQREIIELVELAGFKYAEAAEILAIPVGTVMSRLSRARLSLLEAIENDNIRPLASRRRRPR
ncbi:sigma-70 family RNA polymerase sigma factor [Bosea sp. (in: a-proteobacteria)]|uniref:RNA polymerase sigma factor n=1 Tax=Bosea sp. (in: a-proteobacteria) TaxID=1871050 RepID=UPI00261B30E1|nr:sigma-70 family RNA polymerase sigma factor [Bosea sp. (in: a-proteobacteria)]MCO5091296.1 sigma-70 family RNA polymerase sigma factor [Bosea sp. (in: a-proteobacteria)]